MDFEKFRRETADAVDKELKDLLKEWKSEVSKVDSKVLPLVDEFINSCYGGKRLRGILVVLGYQIGKQSSALSRQSSDIFKMAAAYEIFHTAILAHDDIMDKSLTRRDQPSLFQALGGDHKGTSLAITLADAGFFLATKIIAESSFPQKEKNEALKYFSAVMLNTAIGQILDIEKGDSIIVAKYKTAKYTVSGTLVLGAILAGAKTEELSKLDQFGESLGIAFQIQDDILDSEIDWLGGMSKAKEAAKQYKNKALEVLPSISKDKNMSKLLQQLADYLVERSR